MLLERWSTGNGDAGLATIGRHGRLRIGRLQIGWHVYHHRYAHSSDRFVIQPFAIYDRRAS